MFALTNEVAVVTGATGVLGGALTHGLGTARAGFTQTLQDKRPPAVGACESRRSLNALPIYELVRRLIWHVTA